jgi:hypothetical protein
MADETRKGKARLEDPSRSMNRAMAGMYANRNARGGGMLGGIMGWAGLPGVRRNAYNFYGNGGMGGGFSFGAAGNGGGGGGGDGGNDPSTDPNDPAALGKLGKVGGFPQWYIDWFNSQGKYGGVPPVQGLL